MIDHLFVVFMQRFSSKKLIRFAATGVSNTLLHALIALSLIEMFLVRPTLANVIAYSFCTFFSYVVNTRWSFSERLNRLNFKRFVVVSLLGFMVAMALAAAVEAFGLPPFLGVLAVVCVVPVVSFVMHHCWTYRPH